jgi:hypothetical protein
MKRSIFLCVVMLAAISLTLAAADMTGLVTCSKCRHTDENAMSCATTCLRNGVPAMFYDQASQKLYKVANQEAVKEHFGTRVVVSGKVDGDSVTVATIKPAPAKGK